VKRKTIKRVVNNFIRCGMLEVRGTDKHGHQLIGYSKSGAERMAKWAAMMPFSSEAEQEEKFRELFPELYRATA